MNKTRLTEEVFKMRFDSVFDRFKSRNLSCEEAADLLGVSVSTFYRKRQRYQSDDFEGCFDRRLDRVSTQRAADREVEFITRLYSKTSAQR